MNQLPLVNDLISYAYVMMILVLVFFEKKIWKAMEIVKQVKCLLEAEYV